jgi:hypothetical protein
MVERFFHMIAQLLKMIEQLLEVAEEYFLIPRHFHEFLMDLKPFTTKAGKADLTTRHQTPQDYTSLKNPKLANSEVRACCCLQYCANANLSTEY